MKTTDFHKVRLLRDLKVKVFKIDGPNCVWCGRETQFLKKKGEEGLWASLEHVIPVCFGGSDEFENLTIACYECNQKRQHPPEVEILDMILNKLEDKKRINRLFWCSTV